MFQDLTAVNMHMTDPFVFDSRGAQNFSLIAKDK